MNGRVKEDADAAETGVEMTAAAVGEGVSTAFGGGDAAAEIGAKFDGTDLEEVVVDAACAAKGIDVVVEADAGGIGDSLSCGASIRGEYRRRENPTEAVHRDGSVGRKLCPGGESGGDGDEGG